MRASWSVGARVSLRCQPCYGGLYTNLSTDGHVFIWHKSSGIAVERLEAHHPRTNSVTWNPADPCMFATCGDDGKIKMYVWAFYPGYEMGLLTFVNYSWSNKERSRQIAYKSPHSNGTVNRGSPRNSSWRDSGEHHQQHHNAEVWHGVYWTVSFLFSFLPRPCLSLSRFLTLVVFSWCTLCND